MFTVTATKPRTMRKFQFPIGRAKHFDWYLANGLFGVDFGLRVAPKKIV